MYAGICVHPCIRLAIHQSIHPSIWSSSYHSILEHRGRCTQAVSLTCTHTCMHTHLNPPICPSSHLLPAYTYTFRQAHIWARTHIYIYASIFTRWQRGWSVIYLQSRYVICHDIEPMSSQITSTEIGHEILGGLRMPGNSVCRLIDCVWHYHNSVYLAVKCQSNKIHTYWSEVKSLFRGGSSFGKANLNEALLKQHTNIHNIGYKGKSTYLLPCVWGWNDRCYLMI